MSWMDIAKLAVFVAGGIGLVALGQPLLGASLIGGAVGNMAPGVVGKLTGK